MVANKLKKIIFNKLYEDLKHVEIIQHKNSIWFIHREKKYWYLEFEESGILWWRYEFFENFFCLFSLERVEYNPIIVEWVEEVLNSRVSTSFNFFGIPHTWVEEGLNSRVSTSLNVMRWSDASVEEVLNSRVSTSFTTHAPEPMMVQEVLNSKVSTSVWSTRSIPVQVEEVLNSRVSTTLQYEGQRKILVEEVLN